MFRNSIFKSNAFFVLKQAWISLTQLIQSTRRHQNQSSICSTTSTRQQQPIPPSTSTTTITTRQHQITSQQPSQLPAPASFLYSPRNGCIRKPIAISFGRPSAISGQHERAAQSDQWTQGGNFLNERNRLKKIISIFDSCS